MDILEKLNPQQREAVTTPPGPTLVLAGPGSGKTRVLTHRIAYLVGHLGVAPRSILAVTFTNRAAREMKSRVDALLDGGLRGLTIGTFHSICARLLRREAHAASGSLPVTPEFVIFDDSDQQALVKQVLKELNLNDKQYTPGKLLNKISAAKNELIDPDAYAAATYLDEIVKRVYTRYQQLLAVNNAYDFDDLLGEVVRLFDRRPETLAKYQRLYEHLLVDEFQDTNTVQYTMLRQLAASHRNLYCVGDPDQSVYRWRGADYRNVRKFEQDYPDATVLLLEENYRSTQIILDAAMAVIDRHPGRTRKQLFTERQGGAQLHAQEAYNEQEEAQFVVDTIRELQKKRLYRPGDCAVMYRTNAQSRVVEEQFVRAGLPYRLVGAQRFYGRKEIKDLLAYLRLVHNPADSVSFMRIINTPPRGIGTKTLEQIVAAAERAGVSAAAMLRDLGLNGPQSAFAEQFTGKTGLALMTLGQRLAEWHDLKGEVSVVALLDLILNGVNYAEFVNDGSEEGEDRWANVLELRNVAAATPEAGLTEFLEQVALVADQDTLGEEGEAATLLTLHAAKGLEFPVVFMIGLDEGVLPHQRSFNDPESMHEERRLMYVGMTRAKDRLYLVRAFRRSQYGDSGVADASRFLQDIPAKLMVGNLERQQSRAEGYFKKATSWETDRNASHPNAPTTQFRSGQRVRHAQFGDGIVIASKFVSGEEEVDVAFEAMGLKRLVASLANLQLLKG
ncbi:MAG: UvrD-helicase domain-containing protein [Anaerolineales bacterium]|nr:UvrD-helicase domain-containing protein [Anaerolineales bacterium]